MREARTERHESTTIPRSSYAGALLASVLCIGACSGDARPPGGASGGRSAEATATASGAVPAAPIATPTPPPASVDSAPVTPPAVAEFLRFVEAQRASDSVSATRDRAAEGLRLLASAIEGLMSRDTAAAGTQPRIDVLHARADSMARRVAEDSTPTEPMADDARLVTDAFVTASDLLQTLQDRGQPALTDRAAEARQAAAAIRADRPLRDQGDEVQRFFERAAAALRGSVGARTT